MRFAEVLSRCVLGSTGYLESTADLARLRQVIELNLPVLRRFPNLVVATNYGPDDAASLRQANAELWRQHVPTAVLLDSPGNRGHSIGTADLDNLLFDWCRAHGAEWLCKTANDVVLRQSIFDIEVARAQFYYLNAVSYDALAERDFDLTLFGGSFFYPQDTFWALAVGSMDTLVDKDFLDASWRLVSAIPDYNGRIWEHLPGWSCEYLLRRAVERNGLTACSLLTPGQWRRVLDLTIERRLTDCSLKGIEVNGICHVQGLADPAEPLAVVR